MGFTRNYDMLRMLDLGVNTNCNSLFPNGYTNADLYIKKTNGEIVYNYYSRCNGNGYYNSPGIMNCAPLKYFFSRATTTNYNNLINTPRQGATSLIFGTNGAEESYDDYKISTFTTQLFQYNDSGNFMVSQDKKYIINTVWASYLNNSGTTRTIKEVGLILLPDVLIYRKILDTPLIVPANGYFKISFSYKVPIPGNLQPGGDY